MEKNKKQLQTELKLNSYEGTEYIRVIGYVNGIKVEFKPVNSTVTEICKAFLQKSN